MQRAARLASGLATSKGIAKIGQRPPAAPASSRRAAALFDVALMLDGAVGFAEERRMGLFAGCDEEQDTCSGVRPADHHPLVAAGKRPVPSHEWKYRSIGQRGR